ncbi:NAD-dependent protein deacetylase [Hoyosella rhizosphaerae]|nr:NAD-dependent protein deacetylase [Hoyosella rhizosphaerae]
MRTVVLSPRLLIFFILSRVNADATVDGTTLALDEHEALVRSIEVLAAQKVVTLTGAGLSTDSGVPDYRSPTAPKRTPMTISQFLATPQARQQYWARNHIGWRFIDSREPNRGHRSLAALELGGVVTSLITQNVDLLHSKAGHREVMDLHGTYKQVVCLNCGDVLDRTDLARELELANPHFAHYTEIDGLEIAPDADAVVADVSSFQVVDCPRCGGILKPDIVFFGESVPKPLVERAFAAVDAASAMLVVGSSLTVMSGLRFVRYAARQGLPIVIVNRGPTRGDDLATVKVEAGCSEVLSALADVLH